MIPMPKKNPSTLRIAIVGGDDYCREILEKTTVDYKENELHARFVGVADSNPNNSGRSFAEKLGLFTVDDYHSFYDPQYSVDLILISTPEPAVLKDILETKPSHIRVLSYHVFDLFWKAIRIEEKKLRERNEEIETILNGIEDFILVLTPDKEIIEVNDAFLSQMKFSQKEVIGQKCYDVFHKATRKSSNCHLVCPLQRVVREKRPCHAVLSRLNQKGEQRYSELTIFPIWEKNGKISKFIEISRDITKRKRQEEEITQRLEKMVEERTRQLKETHEKLLHQDKMASLGKLSASVVHEINNPIAGILNLTMLLKRIIKEDTLQEKETEQLNQFLDLMEAETRRISRIISNLLAFSRQSKLEPRALDINKLLEKTLLLNSNLLKINGVRVKEKMNPDLPMIVGSEDQLQQVFMNIVSNAAEAMAVKKDAVLGIESRFDPDTRQVAVRFKDSGSGIPKENLSKLFEPFFTTKKRGKGVGLGLSVAYGIVKDHGGSIYTNSKQGKGTTFEIRLPLEPSPDSES